MTANGRLSGEERPRAERECPTCRGTGRVPVRPPAGAIHLPSVFRGNLSACGLLWDGGPDRFTLDADTVTCLLCIRNHLDVALADGRVTRG